MNPIVQVFTSVHRSFLIQDDFHIVWAKQAVGRQSFTMPCELDKFGFCIKCAPCVEACEHLERNLCRRSPHLNTCFQAPANPKRNFEYNSNVKKFTMCTYNVSYNVNINNLVNFLRDEPADIICIQEMLHWQVNHLIKCLKKSRQWRWRFCARSPSCQSIILSTFPLEEVCRGYLGCQGRKRNLQFVTVKVQGFYLTSLHLYAKNEASRLCQLRNLRDRLSEKGVWDEGKMHILAGDFNSLTKEDRCQEGWNKVAAERELSNTKNLGENGFTKLEEPKFDVTASMSKKNFLDCWAQVGRRDLKTTCQ